MKRRKWKIITYLNAEMIRCRRCKSAIGAKNGIDIFLRGGGRESNRKGKEGGRCGGN